MTLPVRCLTILLLCCLTQLADAKPKGKPAADKAAKKPRLSSGEGAVWKALNRRIKFEFKDTPLQEALEVIQDRAGVPVYLDLHATNDRGVDVETPVSFAGKKACMQVLDEILEPLELTWLNQYDVLFITSGKEPGRHLPLMVFQVAKQIQGVAIDDLEEALEDKIEPSSWEATGGPGSLFFFDGILVIRNTSPAHAAISRQFKKVLRPVLPPPNRKPGKTASFDFTRTRLDEIVTTFEKQHGVTLTLDQEALAERGIGPDSTVTLRLRDVPVPAALQLIALRIDDELTLSGKIPNLSLTTIEAANEKLEERTFDVRWLVTDEESAEKLMATITTSVEPESWDETGGPGTIKMVPNKPTLAVKQTTRILKKVEFLLNQVQKARR